MSEVKDISCIKRMTSVLKQIFIAKSDILHWDVMTIKALEKLYELFPFHDFFLCVL